MTAPAAQAPAPGAYFDVPGIPGGATQWTEADDATVNLVTTLSASNAVPVTGIANMMQTDVVHDWFVHATVAQTYTPGTSTLTASAYAPWNQIGPTKLSVQNQYASVDVESGIDLLIFDMIRPYQTAEVLGATNEYADPAGFPIGGSATGYLTAALAQPNLINTAQWSTGAASYNLFFRIPAAQWFDRYYDLALTGEPTSQPHPALVSPQYMAGTTRVIAPALTANPMSATTTDNGPVNIGAGTGTASGTLTTRIRRRAIYAGQQSVLPPVYAWQYRRQTKRFGVGGLSTVYLPLPNDAGQVMAVYLRMFDPAAASALGAPIAVSTLSVIQLKYGSGLFRYDFQTKGSQTAATLWQKMWLEKHPSLLPAGVVAFDLARDNRNMITNANCLNTLTTSGIGVQLSWTGTLSSTAYVTMGIESLVYVT